jgi:hypothetical protein
VPPPPVRLLSPTEPKPLPPVRKPPPMEHKRPAAVSARP